MREEQRYLESLKPITYECERVRSQSVFLTYDRTYWRRTQLRRV